nr:gliding motility-associated C-terminal domain-containing protein [Bacteroidota bacterium]
TQENCEPELTVKNYSQPAVSYHWYLDGEFISDNYLPNLNVEVNGGYHISLVTNSGLLCMDSVTTYVIFEKIFTAGEHVIPNVFSPNNDGINDYFEIHNINECRNYQLTIFNRWGNKVFHTNNIRHYWNGQLNGAPVPEGVYFYKLQGENGFLRKGNLSLFR